MTASSNLLRIHHAINRQSKRAYHDLITLPSKKPIISQGPPGYSAVTGHVVTVFGCTGFLGRYLVSKLARQGTQVIVPYRDEDEKRHLKPMGDLGQIVPMEWDIRNENQIAECVRHSDIVFNLVGRDYATKSFDFASVQVDGAERIAKIAAQSGVPRFVHVSHLNASATSPSKLYQTKAEGEERVNTAFKGATIIRPGPLYGYEDKLLNNLAIWPIWWKLNDAKTRTRPVHVMDVAQVLANLVHNAQQGRTIALPGPSTLTYEYLLDLVSSLTFQPPSRAPVVPKSVALAVAKAAQAVWWPLLSPDEVVRRYIDDADTPGDWDSVGVTPSEIEQHAIQYVRRYRSAENFSRPNVFPPRPVLVEEEVGLGF
ncbi:39kDa subunit of Ndufa9, NADH ubiquinone oxidoreductase [Lentinula edodes]|uniref:Nadh dehydrogenase n=1 Tax=Lentinula edodes TaxID=5353 RepID=A0A1Q3ET89_LENED|nr:39kDa subunit of Ndufa9, NADH ubiquinone oxidoreductase [Lentinula edodes]KAH7873206.1 39kDa subunit of Ndufa9, NADH ubiquinone oxidoreductase [Lentinula edodes]KAJ3910665.1 39kDa subunit of Ndufa9, NADH ubiquinone oxidoreductase [Lentinula edodes]KAJ3922427.1 39kDa subunit of Ndufa9, NADH ubiquinone oxidoreductase [Lentinula edodes]GAW10409.1 nadh dehydrogenase [Lentinula edodes]